MSSAGPGAALVTAVSGPYASVAMPCTAVSYMLDETSTVTDSYLLLVILEQICVLQIRMEFNLIDRWRGLRGLEDPVEMLGQVVADANGLRQTLGLQLLHLLPFGLVFFLALAEEWGVDKVAAIHQ
jgi:hypothetical protein